MGRRRRIQLNPAARELKIQHVTAYRRIVRHEVQMEPRWRCPGQGRRRPESHHTPAQARPLAPTGRVDPRAAAPTPAAGVAATRPSGPVPAASPTTPSLGLASHIAQAAGEGSSAHINGQMAAKLEEMGLTPQQVDAVVALSREVVERVVWEVVPVLAETLIKEEIARLTR